MSTDGCTATKGWRCAAYARALDAKQPLQAQSVHVMDPFAAADSSDDGGDADMNPVEEAELLHLSNVTTEVS